MPDVRTPVSSLEIQVDGQTPESWSEILAQFADASIYQSWAYGAVRWGARSLSHLVIRCKGEVVAAAQLRIARVPVVPVGLAYLRWGPLCEVTGRPLDPLIAAEMAVRLRREYIERRGFALQINPPAFSGSERAAVFEAAFPPAGFRPAPSLGHYRTVVVDLRPAAEVLRKQLDQKWRNQLNRSEKNGLALEVSDRPEAYREFLQLYEAMRARKPFDTSVDVHEFARIQDLLAGPARLQIFLVRKEGNAIGALVCSLMGDTAIYLLGATNEKAMELKAANFLQWQALMWLKDRGTRWYDLGGIDPVANPGGYHFKSGLGGRETVLLPPHVARGGLAGEVVLRGLARWRQRRTTTVKPGKSHPPGA